MRVRYVLAFQLATISGEARSSGGPFSRGGADSYEEKTKTIRPQCEASLGAELGWESYMWSCNA